MIQSTRLLTPPPIRTRPRRPRSVVSLSAVLVLLVACGGTRRSLVPEPVLFHASEPRELAMDQQVTQALDRLTFGGRPADISAVLHEGLDRWLLRQLTPENWPDRGGDSVAARFAVDTMPIAQLVDESPQLDVFLRRRRRELGLPDTARYLLSRDDSAHYKQMSELGTRRVNQYLAAKLAHDVGSDQQLAALMTDFWENHFSVFRGKMPTQFTLLAYDRDVIRPHALGRFRELLGAVAHSPAMLYYLDNYQSSADSGHYTLAAWRSLARARTAADSARIRTAAMRRRGGLNENYGRELLELHTLGVDGGYTQHDVIDAARALTGWSIRAPREGGEFQFNAGAHDASTKVVLGHMLPAGRGEEDGEALLDLLARDPHTARFIATKLVRHFVADTADPGLVARAAATFQSTDGDIRQVMAVIVSGPELYRRATVRAKVKTPYELVASTYRVLGALPDTAGRAVQLAAQLGQPLFGHPTPEGWPDVADAWMNTGAVLARINFGSAVAAGRIPALPAASWPFPSALRSAPLADQIGAIASILLLGEMSPDTRAVLLSGVNPLARPDGMAGTAAGPRGQPSFADLVGLALGSPEFQRH
jgi:uncharacterized protein (DUF1800 family)